MTVGDLSAAVGTASNGTVQIIGAVIPRTKAKPSQVAAAHAAHFAVLAATVSRRLERAVEVFVAGGGPFAVRLACEGEEEPGLDELRKQASEEVEDGPPEGGHARRRWRHKALRELRKGAREVTTTCEALSRLL